MSTREDLADKSVLNKDTAAAGMQVVICEIESGSRTRATLESSVYTEDDTLVVDVQIDGQPPRTLDADMAGLCGNRYTGKWSHICIRT